MNITRENIDDLNAVLKVTFGKADFEGKVETVLKDYRKKANIKGFRPGMVPIGLVRKIYGRAVQIDEINKLVTEGIQNYIADEKIDVLGDPMPKAGEHDEFDFDAGEEFTFEFELGLSPVFNIDLSKKDIVPYYEIEADEKMKKDYVSNYASRYGELKNGESVEPKDVLKGKIEQAGTGGRPAEGGISVETASLSVDLIKDEEIKSAFIGKVPSDEILFDVKKAYPNDSEVAGLLRIKKEEAEAVSGNFLFIINEISRFTPAEVNQELFDKVYGEGTIASEEEFTARIEEEIKSNLAFESDYKLSLDLKELILNKIQFDLPEEFLKRWLLKVNEKTTAEQIETEFDSFRKDLRWQLIRNRIARDNEMQISDEELQKEAEKITRQQFNQYGLYYATDEHISNYAKETLKREDDAKRIADRVLEDKVLLFVKDLVKLDTKKVSAEEFNKLFA
jgi:trigger factor